MADESENLTLKLLREMRAEQERLASMLGKVTDAVTQIAATQDHHSQILDRTSDTDFWQAFDFACEAAFPSNSCRHVNSAFLVAV